MPARLLCLPLLVLSAVVIAAPKPPSPPATYRGRTVAEWVAQLRGEDIKRRWPAILALKELGPAAKDAVPTLLEILRKDADVSMRAQAALVLGEIGDDARGALPALRDAVKDESGWVREEAVLALENIGGEGAGVRALIDLLRDECAELRGWAASALKQFGPAAESAAPGLRDLLKDADAGVRLQVAVALAEIGAADERDHDPAGVTDESDAARPGDGSAGGHRRPSGAGAGGGAEA